MGYGDNVYAIAYKLGVTDMKVDSVGITFTHTGPIPEAAEDAFASIGFAPIKVLRYEDVYFGARTSPVDAAKTYKTVRAYRDRVARAKAEHEEQDRVDAARREAEQEAAAKRRHDSLIRAALTSGRDMGLVRMGDMSGIHEGDHATCAKCGGIVVAMMINYAPGQDYYDHDMSVYSGLKWRNPDGGVHVMGRHHHTWKAEQRRSASP